MKVIYFIRYFFKLNFLLSLITFLSVGYYDFDLFFAEKLSIIQLLNLLGLDILC